MNYTYIIGGILKKLMNCGCHCIKCKSTDLDSNQVGKVEKDGYFDMHHTCRKCNTHFDHLEGDIFENCEICGFAK